MPQLQREQLNAKWQELIQIINEEKQIDQYVIMNLFNDQTQLFNIDGDLAIIEVPYMVQKQLMAGCKDYIEEKLSQVFNKTIHCQFYLSSELKKIEEQEQIDNSKKRNEKLLISKIEKEYTFENFVIGKCNREAHAAAISTCLYPATMNNPLFIYGNSGLGKTHLLHAIANYILEEQPDKKLLYISSNDLVDLLINSIKDRTIEEIKDRISELDYLLIDDIQRLKQSGSQEIFFNLYNKLISDNKRIIFTSDIPPRELTGIEYRLVSRFEAGLTVYVGQPEHETALAILKKKLEGKCEAEIIKEDVLDFLATNYSNDIRALEGKLKRLIFLSVVYKPDIIDMDFTLNYLIDKQDPTIIDDNKLNPTKIKKIVCEYYGLTIEQVESKSRMKNIANARNIAIYLCRKYLSLPFLKIGFEFGNRDHSTIKSSHDRVVKLMKEDNKYQEAIAQLESKINK